LRKSILLKLTNGETVKLIGIDFPEIYMRLDIGKEATEYVRKMLEGRKVKIEYDARKKDDNGRILAYIFIPTCPKNAFCEPSPPWWYEVERRDSYYLFINATIIKAGYALPLTIPPHVKYADLFKKLHKEAKEAKRGFWKEKVNLGLPDYKALARECQKKQSVGCCMASVRAMEKGQFMLDTGKTFAETTCPKGYAPNMMKCIDSYRWCIPKRNKSEKHIAVDCPQDEKDCPDGTTVNRAGPNCEFKKCPSEKR